MIVKLGIYHVALQKDLYWLPFLYYNLWIWGQFRSLVRSLSSFFCQNWVYSVIASLFTIWQKLEKKCFRNRKTIWKVTNITDQRTDEANIDRGQGLGRLCRSVSTFRIITQNFYYLSQLIQELWKPLKLVVFTRKSSQMDILNYLASSDAFILNGNTFFRWLGQQ